jgi:hypothetical protein
MLNRDLRGANPTTIVSSLPSVDYLWLPDGRLIYFVQEPQPSERTSNFWEMRLDPRTTQPRDKPKRLTNWTGFVLANRASPPTVDAWPFASG